MSTKNYACNYNAPFTNSNHFSYNTITGMNNINRYELSFKSCSMRPFISWTFSNFQRKKGYFSFLKQFCQHYQQCWTGLRLNFMRYSTHYWKPHKYGLITDSLLRTNLFQKVACCSNIYPYCRGCRWLGDTFIPIETLFSQWGYNRSQSG